MGCAPPVKVAEAQPPPAPAPEAAPEPEPVEETPPAPIAPVPATPQYEAAAAPPFASKFGFAMLLGGGFQDFTHTNARALTSGGGSWDARIVGGTRSYIGFEAAYVGSANNIRVLGASTNSSLVGNGLEGALRLNVPIVMGASMIEPFGFAGLGWSNFRVTNNRTFTSDFATRSDNVMTVPLGGGIAYTYKAFTLDARGGWTGTYYNNILLTPTTTTTGNRLDHWGVGGNLGVAF
jgi:hypothetical protein